MEFSNAGENNQTDYSYRISDYSATFTYDEGRTFAVEERITAVFNSSDKHGIIRDLPINSGETYYDIKVEGAPYSVSFDVSDFGAYR